MSNEISWHAYGIRPTSKSFHGSFSSPSEDHGWPWTWLGASTRCPFQTWSMQRYGFLPDPTRNPFYAHLGLDGSRAVGELPAHQAAAVRRPFIFIARWNLDRFPSLIESHQDTPDTTVDVAAWIAAQNAAAEEDQSAAVAVSRAVMSLLNSALRDLFSFSLNPLSYPLSCPLLLLAEPSAQYALDAVFPQRCKWFGGAIRMHRSLREGESIRRRRRFQRHSETDIDLTDAYFGMDDHAEAISIHDYYFTSSKRITRDHACDWNADRILQTLDGPTVTTDRIYYALFHLQAATVRQFHFAIDRDFTCAAGDLDVPRSLYLYLMTFAVQKLLWMHSITYYFLKDIKPPCSLVVYAKPCDVGHVAGVYAPQLDCMVAVAIFHNKE